MGILPSLFTVFRSAFRSRVALELENFALRHQLNVLKRSVPRPHLTPADRYLWVDLWVVIYGSSCRVFGKTGARPWPSSGRRPSSRGIAKAFACSGPGKCAAANQGDRRSPAKSAI